MCIPTSFLPYFASMLLSLDSESLLWFCSLRVSCRASLLRLQFPTNNIIALLLCWHNYCLLLFFSSFYVENWICFLNMSQEWMLKADSQPINVSRTWHRCSCHKCMVNLMFCFAFFLVSLDHEKQRLRQMPEWKGSIRLTYHHFHYSWTGLESSFKPDLVNCCYNSRSLECMLPICIDLAKQSVQRTEHLRGYWNRNNIFRLVYNPRFMLLRRHAYFQLKVSHKKLIFDWSS